MDELKNITQNDIKIMGYIYNLKNGKGLSKAKGITIEEIKSLVGFLSESKIRSTIRLLLKCGYVDYGIKNGKMNTYHITAEGLNYIKSIKEIIIDLREEEE